MAKKEKNNIQHFIHSRAILYLAFAQVPAPAPAPCINRINAMK